MVRDPDARLPMRPVCLVRPMSLDEIQQATDDNSLLHDPLIVPLLIQHLYGRRRKVLDLALRHNVPRSLVRSTIAIVRSVAPWIQSEIARSPIRPGQRQAIEQFIVGLIARRYPSSEGIRPATKAGTEAELDDAREIAKTAIQLIAQKLLEYRRTGLGYAD